MFQRLLEVSDCVDIFCEAWEVGRDGVGGAKRYNLPKSLQNIFKFGIPMEITMQNVSGTFSAVLHGV